MYTWRMAIRSTHTQFPQIMQSMINLGVKHYRDGLTQYAPSFQYENAEMLGKAGIKADWLMDFKNSATDINSAYANAPDATEEFEGPNEDDAEAGPPLLAFMQLLNRYCSRQSCYRCDAHHCAFLFASVFVCNARQSQLVDQLRQHA